MKRIAWLRREDRLIAGAGMCLIFAESGADHSRLRTGSGLKFAEKGKMCGFSLISAPWSSTVIIGDCLYYYCLVIDMMFDV